MDTNSHEQGTFAKSSFSTGLRVGKGEKGVRGYTPVMWCAERLPANIRVVSPEELIWRIRMQHDPAETKRVMESVE